MNGAMPGLAAGIPHQSRRGRVLGRVTGNESTGSLFWLTIEVPGWAEARPGQFALLQAEPSRCFLGRALSISDEEKDRVSFLVDPVGEGTRELCSLSAGDPAWVLGPLGNGFDLDEVVSGCSPPGISGTTSGKRSRLVVVAGGAGVAPFPLFLSRLARRKTARAGHPEVVVLLGFRDASRAQGAIPVRGAVRRSTESGLSCRLVLATEDGSLGPPQRVTDLLETELRPGDQVVVCGPPAMSAAVWQICSKTADVRTWFSLEANMACGVGSCHGCAVALADGSFARVCHDGPVFPGERVFGGYVAPVAGGKEPA